MVKSKIKKYILHGKDVKNQLFERNIFGVLKNECFLLQKESRNIFK
jgi:hypothetical protein